MMMVSEALKTGGRRRWEAPENETPVDCSTGVSDFTGVLYAWISQ
jgi:hypothetical protein